MRKIKLAKIVDVSGDCSVIFEPHEECIGPETASRTWLHVTETGERIGIYAETLVDANLELQRYFASLREAA